MQFSVMAFEMLLVFFAVLHVCSPQTFQQISQNFCQTQSGVDDNLSCPEDPDGGVNCFNRDLLCNTVDDCTVSASDEGDVINFNSLQCEYNQLIIML